MAGSGWKGWKWLEMFEMPENVCAVLHSALYCTVHTAQYSGTGSELVHTVHWLSKSGLKALFSALSSVWGCPEMAKMAVNGVNNCKWLKLAVHGCK